MQSVKGDAVLNLKKKSSVSIKKNKNKGFGNHRLTIIEEDEESMQSDSMSCTSKNSYNKVSVPKMRIL